jgi:hypothetical protein
MSCAVVESACGTALPLQLLCDEVLHHLTGAVRFRPRFGHPLVLGPCEYLQVAIAASRLVGRRDLFLYRG